MKKTVNELTEKDVQLLIADYPWLLNLDYEIVPELKNRGLEYQLTENKRADLILRDRKSGRPVVVEFKAVPFYRENIGQILEYRARILNEYSSENSLLKAIFNEQMFSPILILVVPECSSEARLACNLSGIDIYEYYSTVPEIIVPEKRKTLDDYISNIKEDDIPFTAERTQWVDEVYERLQHLLVEEELAYGWKNYRSATGEYFANLNHLFINKCLFTDYDISIGVYENVFSETNNITIEYYSDNFSLLEDFIEEYKKLNLRPEIINNIDKETYDGSCWGLSIDKGEFIDNTKQIVKPFILNYVRVMQNLKNLLTENPKIKG